MRTALKNATTDDLSVESAGGCSSFSEAELLLPEAEGPLRELYVSSINMAS